MDNFQWLNRVYATRCQKGMEQAVGFFFYLTQKLSRRARQLKEAMPCGIKKRRELNKKAGPEGKGKWGK